MKYYIKLITSSGQIHESDYILEENKYNHFQYLITRMDSEIFVNFNGKKIRASCIESVELVEYEPRRHTTPAY